MASAEWHNARGFRDYITSVEVQSRLARLPVFRWILRREGAHMFDLVAGFCHSQVLQAFVTLDMDRILKSGPRRVSDLARQVDMPEHRLTVLLRGARALGLIRIRRGQVRLTIRGAALSSVPGLRDMIAHHEVLYKDLSDSAGFFRGATDPDLALFWPYVFGAAKAENPKAVARYSRLMTQTQRLVSEDTQSLVSFRKIRRLLDVGGGEGQFLSSVLQANPGMSGTLFDLPEVVARAPSGKFRVKGGSFRDDPLPEGHDAISLIRILFDHQDEIALALLRKARAALPSGGRLIVSEPMAGSRETDAYYGLYCLAMETGKLRSPQEIINLLYHAGFGRVSRPRSLRPFITSVVLAHAP